MAHKQTRRSVSISGLTYARLHTFCLETKRPASHVVEQLLKLFLDETDTPTRDILREVVAGAKLTPVSLFDLFIPRSHR